MSTTALVICTILFLSIKSYSQELPCKSYYAKAEGGSCKEKYLEDDSGKKNGKFIVYEINGDIEVKGQYSHGARQGAWSYKGYSKYLEAQPGAKSGLAAAYDIPDNVYCWYERDVEVARSEKPISSYEEAVTIAKAKGKN
ncbi:MAG: hypothetical protein JST69_06790 [Bacteroidetes bacterium]|nr:hypothetical protein [Bacteroidota bacterium]